MRDVVLEEYKNEVKHLQERVRVAEENSNEAIITGLRQELLDARLQHERMKQSYEDEAGDANGSVRTAPAVCCSPKFQYSTPCGTLT